LAALLVLNVWAHSEVRRLEQPSVELRPLGDVEQALTRIRDQHFTTRAELDALIDKPQINPTVRLAYTYAPLLLEQPGMLSGHAATPLGVFYTVSSPPSGLDEVVTINYYLYLSREAGGKPLALRMARYGRPFDAELLCQIRLLNGVVLSAVYQAPIHRMLTFDYPAGSHPVFAIASDNNNFRLVDAVTGPVLTPIPQPEFSADAFHDPDFLALAGQQALLNDGIDISHYVYVWFYCEGCRGPIDVSVLIDGRWYHTHDALPADLLGESVTVPGYYQAGVPVSFAPRPSEIRELRIVTRNTHPVRLHVLSVFVHPELRLTG
jgi:hypothetical protein